jgi:hypothetical protein
MSNAIRNTKDLKTAIIQLEQQKATQEKLLLDELHAAYENLKPANVLKTVASSPTVRNGVVKAAIGLGAGMLTENLLLGGAAGPLKKLIGNVLKFGIATLVTRVSGKRKNKRNNLLTKLQ